MLKKLLAATTVTFGLVAMISPVAQADPPCKQGFERKSNGRWYVTNCTYYMQDWRVFYRDGSVDYTLGKKEIKDVTDAPTSTDIGYPWDAKLLRTY